MTAHPTVGDGIPQAIWQEWPKDTIVNGKKLMVFARCACGKIIPMDYLRCLECDPDRQICTIGFKADGLKIRGISE